MKEVGRLRGVIQKDRGLPADADSDAEEGVAQEQAPLEQVPRKTTTTDWGLWQSNWAVKNPNVPRDLPPTLKVTSKPILTPTYL